jgi:queuine tRNA-ribosyltransferase
MLSVLVPQMRPGAPLHLLGIGDEASMRACVPLGIDTFDSAFPTRLGRHGTLLTSGGRVTLRKAEHAQAFRPPDEQCGCHVCRTYTLVRPRAGAEHEWCARADAAFRCAAQAYLHHLWRANEPVLASLAALHNTAHTLRVAAELRQAILEDRV